MSLCGFDTAFAEGKPNPWCWIASKSEWEQYEYYHDLERYWEDAYGSPFSRAQGSGWVNELIARLTGTPVHVSGSVNGTLDSDPRTFPIPPQAPCIFLLISRVILISLISFLLSGSSGTKINHHLKGLLHLAVYLLRPSGSRSRRGAS